MRALPTRVGRALIAVPERVGYGGSVVGVADVAHGPGADVLDRDAVHPARLGNPDVALQDPGEVEVQIGGWLAAVAALGAVVGPSSGPSSGPSVAGSAPKTAENGPRRSESFRTSDTRSRHTASGASRPVMTAPPTTTVSDI